MRFICNSNPRKMYLNDNVDENGLFVEQKVVMSEKPCKCTRYIMSDPLTMTKTAKRVVRAWRRKKAAVCEEERP